MNSNLKILWEINRSGTIYTVSITPDCEKAGVKEVIVYEEASGEGSRFAGGGSTKCNGKEFLEGKVWDYILTDHSRQTLNEAIAAVQAYSVERPENISDLYNWLNEKYNYFLTSIKKE